MSSKASSLQTKNSVFKRSGKHLDCLIPESQKRKEVWVSGYKSSVLKSGMYSKRGCTVLYTLHMIPLSLVLRPHPLMRRNGLVNQVDFLGLVHTFAAM